MNIFEAIKKNWFNSVALLLGLILVVNLFGGFIQLDLLWKKVTDKSLVTDEEKWQAWLNRNPDLFKSLADGAQIREASNVALINGSKGCKNGWT